MANLEISIQQELLTFVYTLSFLTQEESQYLCHEITLLNEQQCNLFKPQLEKIVNNYELSLQKIDEDTTVQKKIVLDEIEHEIRKAEKVLEQEVSKYDSNSAEEELSSISN